MLTTLKRSPPKFLRTAVLKAFAMTLFQLFFSFYHDSRPRWRHLDGSMRGKQQKHLKTENKQQIRMYDLRTR